jgi:hypothetical protein
MVACWRRDGWLGNKRRGSWSAVSGSLFPDFKYDFGTHAWPNHHVQLQE